MFRRFSLPCSGSPWICFGHWDKSGRQSDYKTNKNIFILLIYSNLILSVVNGSHMKDTSNCFDPVSVLLWPNHFNHLLSWPTTALVQLNSNRVQQITFKYFQFSNNTIPPTLRPSPHALKLWNNILTTFHNYSFTWIELIIVLKCLKTSDA